MPVPNDTFRAELDRWLDGRDLAPKQVIAAWRRAVRQPMTEKPSDPEVQASQAVEGDARTGSPSAELIRSLREQAQQARDTARGLTGNDLMPEFMRDGWQIEWLAIARKLEQAADALASAPRPQREMPKEKGMRTTLSEQADEIVRLRAALTDRIAELEAKHGTAESCGWHDGMDYQLRHGSCRRVQRVEASLGGARPRASGRADQ